jgi:hypothetical protein
MNIYLVVFEAEQFGVNEKLSVQAQQAVIESQKIIKNLSDKIL